MYSEFCSLSTHRVLILLSQTQVKYLRLNLSDQKNRYYDLTPHNNQPSRINPHQQIYDTSGILSILHILGILRILSTLTIFNMRSTV